MPAMASLHCVAQNNSLRNLRADLWRQQVSMREKQVAIAEIISRTDENTRLAAIDLLIGSAEEADALRERNNIWNGGGMNLLSPRNHS